MPEAPASPEVDFAAPVQRWLSAPAGSRRTLPGTVTTIGRLAGNRAAQRVVERNGSAESASAPAQSAVVQRNGDGDKAEPGKTPVVEPPKGKSEPDDPLSKKTALKIITDTFSGVKKDLVEGKVEVLGQAEFQAAFDKIYGAGDYSWEKYVKPKFGNLEGFAHEGTNYINRDMKSTNIGTVVHEMLHNNTAGDWRGVVGNQFDEGTTEYLSLEACNAAKAPYGKSYPDQLSAVEGLIAAGLPVADLRTAYLVGGGQKLLADWFDKTMEGTWADFKTKMQAEDYTAAKAKIKKKSK